MSDNKRKYWDGTHNKIIRYYFYCLRGVDILNSFRNLFFIIIGIYISLKLTNPIWFVVMFIPSVLILIGVGWYSVHKMGKVTEFLNIEFSTVFSRYQYQLLEEIRDELKKINQPVSNKPDPIIKN